MKMDFDFSTIVYTLAVIAYTIYSWTKKDGPKGNKLPKPASDEGSGVPKPQGSGRDAEPRLPDWLRDLLDENSDAQQSPDGSGPMAQPAPAPVNPVPPPSFNTNERSASAAETRQRRSPSPSPVRHRDSQEVLQTDYGSLEVLRPEIKSLEDAVSPYEVVGHKAVSPAIQTADGKVPQALADSGSTSESSGYLQFQDLRRAIIWSEILKPHPEQASNLH